MRKPWAYRGAHKSVIEIADRFIEAPRSAVKADGTPRLWGALAARYIERHTRPAPNPPALPLAFMPGFACNLGCSYCYQRTETNPTLKPSIGATTDPDALASFVATYSQSNAYDEVSLTILGGEPILYWDRSVLPFIHSLRSNITIASIDVVTNATLLDSERCYSLRRDGVTSTQVTLDGSKADHDYFRHFKNNQGTYNTILESLSAIQRAGIELHIRVNLTSKSITNAHRSITDVADWCDPTKTTITFALIDDTWSYRDTSWQWEEALVQYESLHNAATQEGFTVLQDAHRGNCSTCSRGVDRRGLVLAANGKLYSCWDSAGQAGWEIGTVRDGFNVTDSSPKWVQCGFQSERDAEIKTHFRRAAAKGIYRE